METPTDREPLVVAGVAAIFATAGLALGLLPYAEPSAWYLGLPSVSATPLLAGIAGGTLVGRWAAVTWVASTALQRGETWAPRAILASGAVGLVLHVGGAARTGQWAAAAIFDLLPFVLLVPLLATRLRAATPPLRTTWSTLAEVAAWIGIASGVAIAFLGTTPLFAPWFSSLDAAQLGGQRKADVVTWFLPMGAGTAAHFTLLAFVARHARGAVPVLVGAGTVLAWFVVDSGFSLLAGGAFNVWMVNVPCLVLFLLLWGGAAIGRRGGG